MDSFENWYEKVLERVQRYFSGTVASYADRSFAKAWAQAYYEKLGPELAMVYAVANIGLIFAEYEFSVADVDYAGLSDPEDRLSVLLPAGYETEFSELYKLSCLKMHQHNLEKGLAYPHYDIAERIHELSSQFGASELSNYGGYSTDNWWENG